MIPVLQLYFTRCTRCSRAKILRFGGGRRGRGRARKRVDQTCRYKGNESLITGTVHSRDTEYAKERDNRCVKNELNNREQVHEGAKCTSQRRD